MVVSLLKVLHSGIQDERLQSVKPTLAGYIKLFHRAGRFATQLVRLDFSQNPQFGQTASVVLHRKGHLLSRLYLVTTLPDITTPQLAARAAGAVGPSFRWTNSVGHALIQEATVNIGGTLFDRLTGPMLEVLDEFQTPLEKVPLTDSLIQRQPDFYQRSTELPAAGPSQVITPLPFWFARKDPAAWLPVDALSAAEVRVDITFAPWQSLYYTDSRIESDPASLWPMAGSKFYKLDAAAPRSYHFSKENWPRGLQISPIEGVGPMPTNFQLGDTYVIAEYVYLDKVEANRFRISEIETPIVQHYYTQQDTRGVNSVQIPLEFPNPVRDIFFYCQRPEAVALNAPFLATRDISGADQPYAPWWPDASLTSYQPAFIAADSEPIESLRLVYEGQRTRYQTSNPAFFRSILPSLEQKKAPFYNRYYYNLSMGFQHGLVAASQPMGEANFSMIQSKDLLLTIKNWTGASGPMGVNRFLVNVFAETYNVMKIYGGRAGLLFGY